MGAKIDIKSVPVKPYDNNMFDRNSIYDNMPYVKDPGLNVEKVFTRVTGNVIKSYRCQIKDTYEVKHE